MQIKPDIGYIPTPPEVVDVMLTLAALTPADRLYDLGCGDGRIVIQAAQRFGVPGVGIDIDPQRIREANQNAEQAGVSDRVVFRQQNLFESDFSDATVVILYLLPHLNLRLRPELLRQVRSGTRILSHDFDMGDWQPDCAQHVQSEDLATVYCWTVP